MSDEGQQTRTTVLIGYAGHKEVSDERRILTGFGANVVATVSLDTPEAAATFAAADALMVSIQPVTAAIMDAMPRCKIICRIGTGLAAIDIPAATERGIWVTSVPDYSVDEVSSHAMAFLLALNRNLFRHREMSQTGTWRYQTERPIRRLAGQTLGVLGLGRIGSASARKGQGLGLKVIAYDPYLPESRFEELGVRRVDFTTLLQGSDFLTLHVPLTPETRRIICRIGTGLDAIDIPAATERGIWVTSVPDYSIDEVSTHAISLLLALNRNLFRHRNFSGYRRWRYETERPIRRLAGQTLGVLGLGRIGSASARKGTGLGLTVIAHDPYLPEERFAELGVRPVGFDTLLRESDFLTLHVPLTDETRHIINGEALRRMKPTAFLVNTARGDVVDINALVEEVRMGTIAGAGVDVLPVEPPLSDHPVLREESIIVTPHVAWASNESAHDVRERGAQDVVRVLRGERPIYPANEPADAAVAAQ